MLTLTRAEGERIVIGRGIEILVVRVRGGKVRLAIDAPKATGILRKEVADRIAAERVKDEPE